MVIEMFASFVDSLSVQNVQGYITQGQSETPKNSSDKMRVVSATP